MTMKKLQLRVLEDGRPHVYRLVQPIADSSTGSFTPRGVEGDKEGQGTEANDSSSTWSQYIDLDWEIEGTSDPGGSDPATSHSSVPISCTQGPTLQEKRSASGGPTLHELRTLPQQDVDNAHGEFLQTEGVGEVSEPRNDSQPGVKAAASAALPRHSVDHCHRRRTTTTSVLALSDIYIDRPAAPSADLAQAGPPGRSASLSSLYHNDLPRFARNMESSTGSEGANSSRQSAAQYPMRTNYRFASASLEASLLERMETRQRLQDAAGGEERVCGHVISPEDLIWGSVKHYCGMVLDRETRALLGTAILFMPPYQSEQQQQPPLQLQGGGPAGPGSGLSKAAWVTSVKVVEGRTEVLIKTSKGALHVAQLVLTSTTLGLALFSVHVWQATFALAFLSRVGGPARLPHRLFVDVDRSDRVYVTAYEEPWASESGTLADVRVRPGRIVDAGRHEIVEIDFSAGRLGGSIHSPAGFRGGLVVRADGHLAGVVTGEVLGRHPTQIDFASAFNVYSLLGEL